MQNMKIDNNHSKDKAKEVNMIVSTIHIKFPFLIYTDLFLNEDAQVYVLLCNTVRAL